MEIKYKIWLEKDGKVVFGHGREELFQAIEECLSLNAAARKLGMSYRAAWGRLKASETRLGIKLVETDGVGKAMFLTPVAKAMLEKFKRLEKMTQKNLMKASIELSAMIKDYDSDHK
ncbi:MAG: LysR family transcriptional regulator [Syntrophales bacterium]|nr:LysR family transcriptional regulator [Syntrophales bacterium]